MVSMFSFCVTGTAGFGPPALPPVIRHVGPEHIQAPLTHALVTCVHPQTRRARGLPLVICPSPQHDSTGSTVDTFLKQDLDTDYEDVFNTAMETIPEETQTN